MGSFDYINEDFDELSDEELENLDIDDIDIDSLDDDQKERLIATGLIDEDDLADPDDDLSFDYLYHDGAGNMAPASDSVNRKIRLMER